MFAVATLLTFLTFTRAMTPWLLLLLTLALSLGDAIEAPTWRAIFPELVKKDDLTAALALNGIEFNLARAVGPGLAGLIIAVAGTPTAFLLDAMSFLGVIFVVFTWRRPARKSKLPSETLSGASWAAIGYVRYSPEIRTLLLRSGAVILFASSFWALLPALARELSKNPLGYGFLLGSFGVGAVLGAIVLQRVKSKLSTETVLSTATAVFGALLWSTAVLHNLVLLCTLMLFGGAAWTVFMSLFNTIIQKLAPDWVRARVLAAYLFVFQGSTAIGSALLGLCGRTHQRSSGAARLRDRRHRAPAAAVSFSPSNRGNGSQHLEPLGQPQHVRGLRRRSGSSPGHGQISHRSYEGIGIPERDLSISTGAPP
jgi:predicted MFS family arabinose efflux permease